MRNLELTPDNIRDLKAVDKFKAIAMTIYGLILQTQIALMEAGKRDEIAIIMSQQEQAAFTIFQQAGICLSDRIVYKISSILIDLSLRASNYLRENKKRSRIRGRVLTLEPPSEI